MEENTTLETLGASNLPDYLKSAEGAAIFNKISQTMTSHPVKKSPHIHEVNDDEWGEAMVR